MRQGRLRGQEDTAAVRGVHVFVVVQRGGLERLAVDERAGIVHEDIEPTRLRDEILDHTIHLLFVGHLTKSKGVLRAIEIVAELNKKGIDCRFDIVGDGPERENAKKRVVELNIHSLTHFHGWLPKKNLSTF